LRPAIERGRLHALAHVTGGGIAGNLVRVLPPGRRARVHPGAWERPPIFEWLARSGGIPEDDAREAFNLGIGMVVVCSPEQGAALAGELACAGEAVVSLGDVVAGERGVEWVAG
jgi:phosphoribosylformylglycinamidine cyclo-ligase